MLAVGHASDASASNFIGTGQKTTGYAVTNDGPTPTKHPSLTGVGHREEPNWWNNSRFVLDWLIACPSQSASYTQYVVSRQSFDGSHNHEHDTGGKQYGY